MKKLLLTAVLTTVMSVSVFAGTSIIANGTSISLEKEVKIIDGRSYLPLREVGEKVLNANVEWDEVNKTAILRKGVSKISVPIGSSTISVNNINVAGDAPAFIENGTTYVPVRAIAEGFNMNVGYENKTITITEGTLPQLTELKEGETIAVMHTNYGDIKFRFFPKYAPKAVENFITHAKEGYYNNIAFHRVIKDFVIQGGDPEGTGAGGESIWGNAFENEVTPYLRHFRGALCMANAEVDPSNGSQFYIVQGNNWKDYSIEIEEFKDSNVITSEVKDYTFGELYDDTVKSAYNKLGGYPYLDMDYTVFGQVVEGMDIVDKIASVNTDYYNRPLDDVIIESIEISEQ